ncbi:MAG: chalcone isomerase family protein [Burkholderiales bacterium]
MATRVALVALAFWAAFTAQAAEVAGVKLEERTKVGGAELVLNGAGLRKRAFFQVYALGLYLAEKKPGAADAIGSSGAKRVAIHMLRDVEAATFTEALVDGMRPNLDEATMKSFEPRIAELSAIMAELKEAKKGMAILLDWQPGTGTVVSVDGKARGKPIAGEDFYRALLRIWLGERPVQDDLKKALLGD